MTKTLLISGSPKKGNTYAALSYIYEQLEGEKEMILLKDKNIGHCLGCGYCEKAHTCVLQDDMQNIMKKFQRADTIILGSPNYFANVSGMTKKFIDRTLPLYHTQALKNKNIFLIMPGSSEDNENKEYLLQGTFGLVEYQNMKLLGAYGLCTEDTKLIKGKIEKITDQILKNLSK